MHRQQPPRPAPSKADAEPSLPRRIGKYRVLRRLGEGATSEVFLAHDEFNARNVAIKRLRASAATSAHARDYLPRFFAAEAALVGRLRHPNVVQIYDAVAELPEPYVVMEYVDGTTLHSYCRPDQLLPLETVVEVGFKCAMALAYVYRQGLIHRDVKPANVLGVLDRFGGIVDVKVSDFGSVLNLAADTTQVFRIGSLAYMSPEQIDGSEIDWRADMYSLGAVLYHLIAGRLPFDAETQSRLIHKIYHEAPTPLADLRANVPPALDALIGKALEKIPEGRHASWDAFAQALSAIVSAPDMPRRQMQDVLDSERFSLLRGLEFFSRFGDVELWEVVRRAQWQRHSFGTALFRRGDLGRSFHIIAKGEVEVFRDGRSVVKLGAGTSVGEMVYLAPSEDLSRHAADVVVSKPATTIAFTPETLAQLSIACRRRFDEAFIGVLVRRLHAAHEALAHPRRIV